MFKVGDWVEVNAGGDWEYFHGHVGSVVSVPGNIGGDNYYGVYLVVEEAFLGGHTLWKPDELLPAKSEEALALEVLGDEYFE